MAKPPDSPKKTGKSAGKTPKAKAHRPEVQPIGPALAELLNPAINRGESGIGSSTGLQPPPDNSWDCRAGGEAAAHRARASTPKNFPQSPQNKSDPYPTPLRPNPQPAGGRSAPKGDTSRGFPPPNPPPQAGDGSRQRAPGTAAQDDSAAAPLAS